MVIKYGAGLANLLETCDFNGFSIVLLLSLLGHSALSLSLHKSAQTMESVVVLRTANPMPGMLKRMQDVFSDLQANAPNVQFTISIDTSKPKAKAVPSLIRKTVPGASIHVYDWHDVKKSYPVHLDDRSDPHTGWATAWSWHVEPILLARRHIMQNAKVAKNASWWIIEDDVFLCKGSLSQFLKLYDGVQSDLLVKQYIYAKDWDLRDSGNKQFRDRFPESSRWCLNEQVQRYSARFLDHLEKEVVEANITAQSEMFVATECMNNADQFRCENFRSQDVGVYAYNTRMMTQEAVEEVCENSTGLTINHAAKYYELP